MTAHLTRPIYKAVKGFNYVIYGPAAGVSAAVKGVGGIVKRYKNKPSCDAIGNVYLKKF